MPIDKINPALLARFVLVGGSTAAIALGATYALVEGLSIDTTIASTLAVFIAGTYNYVMHYCWTFGTQAPHGVVLVRYLMMCAGALILNAVIMELGVSSTHFHYMLVQTIAAVTVIMWSLSISSIWVFR